LVSLQEEQRQPLRQVSQVTYIKGRLKATSVIEIYPWMTPLGASIRILRWAMPFRRCRTYSLNVRSSFTGVNYWCQLLVSTPECF